MLYVGTPATLKIIDDDDVTGVLIAKKELFRNKVPGNVGGGTVTFVSLFLYSV